MPPLQTGTLDINGAKLHYQTTGDGPPVLLLHSGVADSRMWQPQFDALAAHFRLVAFDMRGFGQSDLPPGEFAFHDDARAVLDYFEIEKAALVGSSMGGSVAINMTLAYPERVTKLILIAPGLNGYDFTGDATIAGWEKSDELYEAGDFEAAAEVEVAMWLDGPQRKPTQVDPELRALIRDAVLLSYGRPEHAESRPIDPPAITRLDEIGVPVLVIEGALDVPDMHTIAATIAKDVPDARKVTIQNAAHLPGLERPAEVNPLIQEFLESS